MGHCNFTHLLFIKDKTMKILLMLLFISACASTPKKEDLSKAWKGQDVSKLDKHKFYSTLPVSQKALDNNEVRYNYIEKKITATGSRTCFGTGFGMGGYRRSGMGVGASSCSPQEYREDNCTHQFIVQNGRISEYDLLGDNCFTECNMMPKGKCK